MDRLVTFKNRVLQYAKRYLTEMLVSFEQLPVHISNIYHSPKLCQEIAVLKVEGKKQSLEVSLQALLERRDILSHMHPLETSLVRLLAEEERKRNGYLEPMPLWDASLFGAPSLACFACIEDCFFSVSNHQHMIVVTIPDTDEQMCLPARDLMNNKRLLESLKNLSAYCYEFDAVDLAGQRLIAS